MLTPQNANATRERGEGDNKKHCEAILNVPPFDVNQLSIPSPDTVKGSVLGAMLRGERISHKECWWRFGSARFSHHIYMLRRARWPVQMIEQIVTTSDAGRAASIGIYFLDLKVIADAGQRGHNYAIDCAHTEIERRAL